MKISLLFLLFLTTLHAFANEGGATSGGGNSTGIAANRVAESVFEMIRTIGTNLYSDTDLVEIDRVRKNLRIVMSSTPLKAPTKSLIQDSDAFSSYDGKVAQMSIYRGFWDSNATALEREYLIHHEIMVMAGLEVTGKYDLTRQFEEYRLNFWKLKQQKKLFCTINVFEKDEVRKIGALVGSSSARIGQGDTVPVSGVLQTKGKKALVWRGIADSTGYFRMQIDEVDLLNPKSREIEEVGFKNPRNIEPMRLYFDPYQLENPLENPLVIGTHYVSIVSCHQY